MTREKPDMIKGTLDMLILKVLSLGPLHGWGISERIQQMSEDELQGLWKRVEAFKTGHAERSFLQQRS